MRYQAAVKIFVQQSPAECRTVGNIYPDLRRVASAHLRREPLAYQWTPASLINETYIRIVTVFGKDWTERDNVVGLWSRMMRNILIDNARAVRARKRNCGRPDTPIDEIAPAFDAGLDTKVGLGRALDHLNHTDTRQANVVRLHFVEGRTLNETAQAMSVSPRTVKRMLQTARGQLMAELS